jgi:hypothetical protein
MSAHELLKDLLEKAYFDMLIKAASANDFTDVEARLYQAIQSDQYMQPYLGESGTKYFKLFSQTVVPKIMPTLKSALSLGICPEIEVTLSELKAKGQELSIPGLGSPQDILYAFTSERYSEWVPTLSEMGFQSACMSGEGKMTVTMAQRLLNLNAPDLVIQELEGTITKDFWESIKVVFSKANSSDYCREIFEEIGTGVYSYNPDQVDGDTATNLRNIVKSYLDQDYFAFLDKCKANYLILELDTIISLKAGRDRINRVRKLFSPTPNASPNVNQEQIALKYMEEGKFLQKLLNGARVEHLQSNVKMVNNLFRSNKCEVDSIFRVVGEKIIILVEAKDKQAISRGQVYQLFETYKLKLPRDWDLEVVAVTRSEPTQQQREEGIVAIIDLAQVYFDMNCLGKLTESLTAIHPKRHFRWEIKGQSVL